MKIVFRDEMHNHSGITNAYNLVKEEEWYSLLNSEGEVEARYSLLYVDEKLKSGEWLDLGIKEF